MRYYYEIAAYFDGIIPKELSLDFDNDGAMIETDRAIEAVVCALDCTKSAIEFAKNQGATLIITHHPLLFKAPYPIDVLRRIKRCKAYGIGVLSYHTRLDSVDGGVNDCFCKAVGITPVAKFPCGRICEYGKRPLADFARDTGKALGVKCEVLGGGNVGRLAVVSGGGKGDIISAKYKYGCDTLLTGEVSHSAMIAAAEIGLNLVCATHYASERVVVPHLKELTEARFPELKVYAFDFDEKTEFGAR